MTDRDRLIAIVKDSLIRNIGKSCKLAENITDDLINEGIIVPPCKVGDKVYFDTYLHGDSVGVQSHKVINVKYVITTEPSKGGIGAEIPDYAFGETVFLTCEEAEKALERSKGNETNI